MPARFLSTLGSQARFALCALLLALLFPVSALAQISDGSGAGNLGKVEVIGSTRFPASEIVAATGLKPGASVTREDLQKAANYLSLLGPFAQVQYRFTTVETGLTVEYHLSDEPEYPVLFDDFPWFTDAELAAALAKSVPLFDGSAPEHGTILDAIATALENMLAVRGVSATVTHELLHDPMDGHPIQQFRTTGAVPNVESITFSDPLAQSDPSTAERLHDLVGKPFSRTAIELFEFEQIRPVYLAHAYLRVRFDPPQAHLPTPLSNQVVVVAPIDPGPVFTWNGVAWKGNSAISQADLDKLVEMKPGAPADGTKIETLWEKVRDAYGHLGYLDVTVEAAPKFDDSARTVTYTAAIAEGPQYHMGNLLLTGLSVEGEHRIRAAWKIAPNAVFDDTFYTQFLGAGIKQAFSGLPFHYEKIGRFLQKDPSTGKVDVMLDFQ